jgi:hypothetical protein
MKIIESVVVTIDGESKSGKTTWMDNIAEEARFQEASYAHAASANSGYIQNEVNRTEFQSWLETVTFNGIHQVTAGNAFRAAAHYVIEKEKAGDIKDGFDEYDTDALRDLLSQDGVKQVLQTDKTIEKRVSSVAQMPGVRALCETIFCDELTDAYHRNGGSNLVIVDARNPVDILYRNMIVGNGTDQVRPDGILPIFIDTPVEVAAKRMPGEYESNVASISARRLLDNMRPEYPFQKPERTTSNFRAWQRQFSLFKPDTGIAVPLLHINDESLPLESIQYHAGKIASAAHDAASDLYTSRLPSYAGHQLDESLLRILALDAL